MATPQHPDIRRSLSPSPKRRRISHSHSHAHAHSPPRLAASSTVATGISGTPRRTPNNSPGRSPHRRASYLSPTKASLARFNPSLLPKSPLKDAPALKPTREDTAQVVPPRLGISTSRGKKVLAYVLGKSDEASEEGAPQRKQKPDYPMTDQSERDSQSATPGSRLQNVVNAVISDLEQTRTPEIPRQFAAIPFGGDDDDHLLPDTPSGVRYEPPRGIFSSGAGRVGRKKPLREKIVENDTSRTNHERPQVQQVTTHRSEPTVVQPLVTGDARTENADDDEAAVEVRDKKRKIDALQEEVNKTKEDIEMWAKYFNDDDNNGDDKELIDLIVGPAAEASKSAVQPLSALLATFLPFSLPFSNSIRTDDAEDGSNEDSIPSHAPIAEADPLPLLQRFTPFKITSTIHAPTEGNKRAEREGDSVSQDGEQVAGAAIDQKHTITLQSPSNHLSCTLDLTITTPAAPNSTPYISALQLIHISHWARREIGAWLNARIADHDLAALGYGLGRYYDIAVRRASCWAKCQSAFPALVEEGKKNAVPQLPKMRHISASKRPIGYYLGRDSLVLRDRNATMRVRWEIGFDWTGEVESRLGARARFPEVWYEVDERRGLGKVPTVFDRLVRERGVFEAVEILSGVVFGNDR